VVAKNPDLSAGSELPQINNTASRPPGILPKNLQAWVLLGISALIVIVVALSGSRTPTDQDSKAVPKSPAAIDPNEARIQEYRKRIEEEARKLAAGQAQAAMGAEPAESIPASRQLSPHASDETDRNGREEKSAIERDKERREYESVFASNIALTYRKEAGKDAVPQEGGSGQPLAKLPNPYGSSPAPQPVLPASDEMRADGQQATHRAMQTADAPGQLDKPDASREPDKNASPSQAGHQSYRLLEGTVIETVLTNRLTGAFSGPVNCMVTTSVYSHDRQHLLIPKGSRVLGEVSKVDTFGQERLAVFFHRLIMPDGYSLRLDRFQGLNQIGETGLRDKTNYHYGKIFGASLAIGALSGFAQYGTGYGIDVSSGDIYRQGVSRSMAESSMRILERFLNILPSFTIREGHRVKIYLSGDLLVPAYEKHTIDGEL
jgi:type IV secretory pathway VirB10-like protein